MDVVAYKNKNTGHVVAFPEPNARLEALDEWEPADPSEVVYSVADAHDRAAAERAAIEAAAAIRLDSAQGAAAAGIAAAQAVNTGAAGTPAPPLPTLSTGDAGERQQRVPVLAKDDALRATGATSFEENRRQAEQEIAHPPTDGVLKRAKADQRRGRTQIGDNPGEHAGPRAAAAAGDATSGQQAGAKTTSTGTSGKQQ